MEESMDCIYVLALGSSGQLTKRMPRLEATVPMQVTVQYSIPLQ